VDDVALASLARIGVCYGPTFAPDSRTLAFIGTLSGSPQAWTVPVAGGAPRQVTALDDPVTSVAWSPRGDWLACTVAPGGGMNAQVCVVRPDGTALRRLTDGGTATNALAGWTRDGAALRVSSNRRDGAALRVSSNRRDGAALDPYLLDPATGDWRLVRAADGYATLLDLDRTGRWAIESRRRDRDDNDLYLLDLHRGDAVPLTPHEGPGSFPDARFAPDGRSLYLITNGMRDRLACGRIALDAPGRPGPVTIVAAREDAELDQIALGDDGGPLALLWNVGGRSELAFYDTRAALLRPGPALPAEVAGGLCFAPDGHHLALHISGAAAPLDIWRIGGAGRTMARLTRSPHTGVDLAALVCPAPVRFPAHDGLALAGWVYRPRGAVGPGPVVLDFHGGPEGQARPYLNPTYQALLTRGIAVFAPDVRGSSGYGRRFVALDNGALRHDAVRDIGACLDYVIGAGIGEAGRIGIMGASYGGYMAMAGLVAFPTRFAAAADLYGIVDFATFFAHTEPWIAAISKAEYGDPDTEADLLRDLSPLHRLGRVSAPTLVLHGAHDTNVPVAEAEHVVARLRDQGVPVEYILFPDEGHGFRKTANRVVATTAIVRWFVAHLCEVGPWTRTHYR